MAWNPFDERFIADPYPTYRWLQAREPIHDPGIGALVVTRYADVEAVLRDRTVTANNQSDDDRNRIRRTQIELGVEPSHPDDRPLLGLDPPSHTRLRRLVQRSFTPMAVAKRREMVAEVVEEHCARLAAAGSEVDLIGQYAYGIPFAVICRLLGLPIADQEMVRLWAHDIAGGLEPFLSDDEQRRAIISGEALRNYLRDQIATKRGRRDDDLISELVAAEEDGDALSEAELLTMLVLLFVAGHETTVNLIGNGIYALLRNPEQLARLRENEDETFAANATDELLRYDSPVQTSGRTTTTPVSLDGVELPAETLVITALGAANRDPAFFGDDADQLDLGRPDAARHQSFGNGIHFCLGAALARSEGELAISRLVKTFPNLRLTADEPVFAPRIVLRGLKSLPLRLS